MKYAFLVLSALVVGAAHAETSSDTVAQTAVAPTPTPASSSGATVAVPAPGKITGVLEARPTVTYQGSDRYTTENTLGLGYQFNPNFEIGAIQYFDTNLYNPDAKVSGTGLIAQDGFLRAKFKNLWTNGNGLSFSYEPRVYYPSAASKRDQGMIAVVRNYLKLSQEVNPWFTLSLYDIPMVHFYSRSGNTVEGALKATPNFENRVYLVADFELGKGFSLSLPLYVESKLHRGFAGAANSGKVSWFVYTWPELLYAFSPNLTLGVAYRSENFVKSDFSEFTLSNAFETGAFQAVVAWTL